MFAVFPNKHIGKKRDKSSKYWEGEERVEEKGERGIAKITMVVMMMKTMITAIMMMTTIVTTMMRILTMKTKMFRMAK